MESSDLPAYPGLFAALCIGAADEAAGDLAGVDPQHIQRGGVSFFRSPEQRAAGGRGCKIHHVCFYCLYYFGTAGFILSSGNHSGYGCDRYRSCYGL